ncbi:MAG: hypothetical protein ABIO78_06435 [Thermoanaerobaculia bacterium]
MLALTASGGSSLYGCGDKFLVVSRGTRHQRAPLARPSAAILVYANPESTLPTALSNLAVDRTLRRAGYHPTSVVSAEELERALREKTWDVIVAGLAEGQAIRARLVGRNGPVILPVAYKTPAGVLEEARSEFKLLLRAPVRAEVFLDVIDDAVTLNQKLHGKARN